MAFVIERFAYTMALAHITMGAESDSWVQRDAATLFPMASASVTTGCVYELFQLIPEVSIIARRQASEACNEGVLVPTLSDFKRLHTTIRSWQPTLADDIGNSCGKLINKPFSYEDLLDSYPAYP